MSLTYQQLKDLLDKDAKLQQALGKELAKAKGEASIEKKILKHSKIEIEIEHHYHCRFCGVTEIKTYKVACINLKLHETKTIRQELDCCKDCEANLEDKPKSFVIKQAIAVINRLSNPATCKRR